jgi:hypothetical protein
VAAVLMGAIVALLGWAALFDLVDRRNGHRRRSVRTMLSVRNDLRAQAWGIQHNNGSPTPLGSMMKDPGEPRERDVLRR